MSRALTDLESPVKALAERLVAEAWIRLKVRVIVTHTLREYAEQAHLYAKGRTEPGPIVTKAKPGYSWHNFGLAFDVAFLTEEGRITWTGPWDKLGAIGEELGLVWGGNFKTFQDRPHFEYHPAGETLATLRKSYEARIARKGGEQEIKWA
jgi:peptidoglycan LD-endopeptidase CwlK